jgi:large subunit ribosomal protein L13
LDVGDYVTVENVEKIRLTGTKIKTKRYFRHTGWLGHWQTKTIAQPTQATMGFALRHAVEGMLPKNRLKKGWLKRLTIK